MHGRPGADRPFLPADVKDSLSIDDVDDFVVRMAVHRCATRWDHAYELGHVETADILVHQVPELAVDARLQHRLVGVADGSARRIDLRAVFLRCLDDDHHELCRAMVLELVLLPCRHVRPCVRLERMLRVAYAKCPSPGLDVEEFLHSAESARSGPTLPAADHALRETLRPVGAVDRDCYVCVVDRSTTSSTCEGSSSTDAAQISWTTPFSSMRSVTRAAKSPYSP